MADSKQMRPIRLSINAVQLSLHFSTTEGHGIQFVPPLNRSKVPVLRMILATWIKFERLQIFDPGPGGSFTGSCSQGRGEGRQGLGGISGKHYEEERIQVAGTLPGVPGP